MIPYTIWFLPIVEDMPLVAKEVKSPERGLLRRLIGAMLVLFAFVALVLVIGPGVAGAKELVGSGNPLVEALESVYKGSTWAGQLVSLAGPAGLIASFFSTIYTYSRQIFALSRASYLPCNLSLTNRKRAPVLTLMAPGVIGFGLSLTSQGNLLILVAVFGAIISYVLMMAAYITLRIRRPDIQCPYRTPGDILTSGVTLVLTCAAVVTGSLVGPRVVVGTVAVYTVLIGHFVLYSRHHLMSGTPEGESAATQAAEQDLC